MGRGSPTAAMREVWFEDEQVRRWEDTVGNESDVHKNRADDCECVARAPCIKEEVTEHNGDDSDGRQ